ncbi:5'/3'-nucleotidase SurE [Halalkalibacter urbisdiaboli]|uniref:5'/3'-nucleotidase SurE n=1 Tax=Halalkalibacter urbisdiaboli TaxID=1960589 RepID=UPI000B430AF7|nr:5'/3'-nucleotidase SurE [Halalkalibacter urbisdiaboli]
MNILVTNDDGIFSPGVAALAEVLQHFAEVHVVCPDKEKSGVSHSITKNELLEARQVTIFGSNVQAWVVNGTPTDCVKLGLEVLLKERPDYVISGINFGPILGRDVYYSGAMAAVAEASLYGISAIAVSLSRKDTKDVNFQHPKRLFYDVMESILENKFPKGVFLNINLPYMTKETCSGIAVVPLDLKLNRFRYVGLKDQHGQLYYSLRDTQNVPQIDESDYRRLKEGYITITPLDGMRTYKRHVRKVEKWFSSKTTILIEESS